MDRPCECRVGCYCPYDKYMEQNSSETERASIFNDYECYNENQSEDCKSCSCYEMCFCSYDKQMECFYNEWESTPESDEDDCEWEGSLNEPRSLSENGALVYDGNTNEFIEDMWNFISLDLRGGYNINDGWKMEVYGPAETEYGNTPLRSVMDEFVNLLNYESDNCIYDWDYTENDFTGEYNAGVEDLIWDNIPCDLQDETEKEFDFDSEESLFSDGYDYYDSELYTMDEVFSEAEGDRTYFWDAYDHNFVNNYSLVWDMDTPEPDIRNSFKKCSQNIGKLQDCFPLRPGCQCPNYVSEVDSEKCSWRKLFMSSRFGGCCGPGKRGINTKQHRPSPYMLAGARGRTGVG